MPRSCRRISGAPPAIFSNGPAPTGFSVTVLDGVTGSGKTETYFAAIAAALEPGGRYWCCFPKSRSARSGSIASAAASGRSRRSGIPRSARRRGGYLARGRERPGPGRRRRALGAVPAVLGSGTDHRRRGARPVVQAGGRGRLSGARHGGAARLGGADPDRAGIGDAVAGNGGQYRARTLRPGASAAPPRGSDAAADRTARHAARAAAGPAASWLPRWSRRRRGPWKPASRCCFS